MQVRILQSIYISEKEADRMCSIMKIIYFKKLFEEGDENSIDLTNIDDLMTSFNEFIIKQMEL